jgi:hypothetical protein
VLKFLRYSSQVALKQLNSAKNKINGHGFSSFSCSTYDEFLRKSLLIVVLQFSIKLKRFNSQIKGLKMAFLRLEVLE